MVLVFDTSVAVGALARERCTTIDLYGGILKTGTPGYRTPRPKGFLYMFCDCLHYEPVDHTDVITTNQYSIATSYSFISVSSLSAFIECFLFHCYLVLCPFTFKEMSSNETLLF